MRTNYEYHSLDEVGKSFMDGSLQLRFGFERKLYTDTNRYLIANFNKVAKWIKDNCPKLNGKFRLPHNPYYWVELAVEDGKAYLQYGSHGWGWDLALSAEETAVMSQGSMQRNPYAFKGRQFVRNNRLEEFLSNWKNIKEQIIAANRVQTNVYSESFEV